ncbi:hypothetical protein E5288_WYG013010 [Bos mutus]|uniref:Uncharacterized protein n=1 Tax=Bos mutus TaxID=72004 RepID=A0A6B0RF40_9CETA|nr:hypothetical protein [Bos mutus]
MTWVMAIGFQYGCDSRSQMPACERCLPAIPSPLIKVISNKKPEVLLEESADIHGPTAFYPMPVWLGHNGDRFTPRMEGLKSFSLPSLFEKCLKLVSKIA